MSSNVARLLPFSLSATVMVLLVPVLVGFLAVKWGQPAVSPFLGATMAVCLACGLATFGSAVWLRRPESLSVNFGELMLWRWFRRKKAEETIVEGAGVLGLVKGEGASVIDPARRLRVLEELTGALEAKDPYTLGHSRRVSRHVYRTAIALGLSGPEIEHLRRAATLHDVGKIRIPDRVLRKPDKLDARERSIIEEHSALGAQMVKGAAPGPVVLAVRHHHESWDGTGYPDHLQGEEIPLFSRIICVADAYDAMTSARPYKAGCDRRTAIECLRAGKNIQFDPEVVEAFIRTLPAALPAAGALLFLAGPAPLLRKVSWWMKGKGGGSVATAVGAVGAAIVVGAAALVTPQVEQRSPVTVPEQVRAAAADSSLPSYSFEEAAALSVGLADARAAEAAARSAAAARRAELRAERNRRAANRKRRARNRALTGAGTGAGGGSATVAAAGGGGGTSGGGTTTGGTSGAGTSGGGTAGGGAGTSGAGTSGGGTAGGGAGTSGAGTTTGGTSGGGSTGDAADDGSNATDDPRPGRGKDCTRAEGTEDSAHCDDD